MRTTLFLSIVLTVLTWNLIGQNVNSAKLDSFFNILGEKNKAMGCIAISKNDHLIYTKAIGYSRISDLVKTAATKQTKYRIGSITKMFTAVMIFQLKEEKKLELKNTLAMYFPDIPNAKKVTIGNLLNHRSGIHNFTDEEGLPLRHTNWIDAGIIISQ